MRVKAQENKDGVKQIELILEKKLSTFSLITSQNNYIIFEKFTRPICKKLVSITKYNG